MTAKKYKVFLSHNSHDKPEIEVIAQKLAQDPEIEVWLDNWNLLPGDPWMEAIEDAISACSIFLFFVGKKGNGPWQHEEMSLAIDQRVNSEKERYRVIPVLLPGSERGDRSKISKYLLRSKWVEFRKSVHEEDVISYLIAGIKGKKSAVSVRDTTVCPFKGLHYFDVDDHSFFFGGKHLLNG